MKRPQQLASSSIEPSIDSPCEANSMVNEFGDIELPNLNTNITSNSSSGFNNMNWVAAREAAAAAAAAAAASSALPSLAWPSTLLNSNHLSMNSLLLKALQLRNTFQPRSEQFSSTTDFSFLAPPQGISQLGTDLMSSNFQASSSNKTVVETMPQQVQQQDQQFNLESLW